MSERDNLRRRLEFLGLDERAAALRHIRPTLEKALGPALDAFYGRVKAEPELRRFLRDDAHIDRAQSAQHGHWSLIARGDYQTGYAENVRRTGEAHARIGLEPRWYVAGYALILEQLIAASLQAHWPRGLGVSRDGRDKLSGPLGAMIKAALLASQALKSQMLRLSELMGHFNLGSVAISSPGRRPAARAA